MGIPVVWGGSAASAIDEKVLRSGYVDYVCLNEGEYTWLEIADASDKKESFEDIEGISYIRNDEYVRNKDREFIDLSVLPDIDWSLVNPENYMQSNYGMKKMLSTYMSKGCYGKCAFCYNPVYHCSKRRKRPLDIVMKEIKQLVDDYGVDGFEFTDEVMFCNRTEMLDFCAKLKEYELNICWSGYLNVATISSEEDFKLMYESGCRVIYYGIESGSDKILKSINKHAYIADSAIATLKKCNESGILPVAMFILGLPDEDEEDLIKSIDLAKKLGNIIVSFCFFTPLPKTELYRKLIDDGRLTELKTLEEHGKIVELESFYANYTKVPTIDLITIRKYMRLRGLFRKGEGQTNKVISMTLKAWGQRGIIHFFGNAFSSALKLISTCSVFLHPKIRKKYGLYFKK